MRADRLSDLSKAAPPGGRVRLEQVDLPPQRPALDLPGPKEPDQALSTAGRVWARWKQTPQDSWPKSLSGQRLGRSLTASGQNSYSWVRLRLRDVPSRRLPSWKPAGGWVVNSGGKGPPYPGLHPPGPSRPRLHTPFPQAHLPETRALRARLPAAPGLPRALARPPEAGGAVRPTVRRAKGAQTRAAASPSCCGDRGPL